MKYALINGEKEEARKGLHGQCPTCLSLVVAKCGTQKIHHWAHNGMRNCDPWWEPETEWHRGWKSHYTKDLQEVSLRDEKTNEVHRADIRTNDGLILELQHSSIYPDERIAREKFYKKMVWIVDGTRLKRDFPRFVEGMDHLFGTRFPHIYQVHWPDLYFPKSWIESSVPVVFDFKGMETIENPADLRNNLYCLMPKRGNNPMLLAFLSRQNFIDGTRNGELLLLLKDLEKPIQKEPEVPQNTARRSIQFIPIRRRFGRGRRF